MVISLAFALKYFRRKENKKRKVNYTKILKLLAYVVTFFFLLFNFHVSLQHFFFYFKGSEVQQNIART